jgi:hypothetical protein
MERMTATATAEGGDDGRQEREKTVVGLARSFVLSILGILFRGCLPLSSPSAA